MTREETLFLRTMFQNRVLVASAQRYEDLFVAVMTKRYPGFRPVKPHGNKGDEANDGYIRGDGKFYQAYAPESPDDKVTDAVSKATSNFRRLREKWNDETTIREYRFVFNDKFKGAYPVIEHALATMKKKHDLEECEPFLAKDLANEFAQLAPDDQAEIIGGVIPRSEFIENISFAALTGVLQHLVDNRRPLSTSAAPVVPDFAEKIKWNDIDVAASFLINGSYQEGAVDDYFNRHGDYARSDIRNLLHDAYNEIRQSTVESPLPDTRTGDQVFFQLLDSLVPKPSGQAQDAAIALIAFFFETCDVFEEPGTDDN